MADLKLVTAENFMFLLQNCVEELVKNFGSTDMEWIRDVPSHKAK